MTYIKSERSDQQAQPHNLTMAFWWPIYSTVFTDPYKEDSEGTYQGPVVQSFVSLMSSLRVISLTVLADSVHNILIFLLIKCE